MSDQEFYSNPGSPMKPIYSPIVKDDGSFVLEKTGEENIQDYIQSFAEECSIQNIIARAQAGDLSVLSKHQGTYDDFTQFPKTYRDVLQIMIDGRAYFDSLPVDVKQQFDNSFENWFATIGSEDWYKTMKEMDMPKDIPEATPDPEVIKDES